MSQSYIPTSLRKQTIADFQGRCAYCHTLTAITGTRLVIDHILPEGLGGQTVLENLCLACHACNEFKGTRIEFEDEVTGKVVPLFHPRQQHWNDHFCWSQDKAEIVGLTPIGRVTVVALKMNHLEIVEARRRWIAVGWHPPQDDL
jgi:hypothetical protein